MFLSVTEYSKVVFCHRNRDCQPEMAISMGEGGVIDRKFNVMWLDTLISYLIRETGFFFLFSLVLRTFENTCISKNPDS